MNYHRYTPEEIQFLKDNMNSHTNAELALLFKDKFGIDVSDAAVSYALFSRNIMRNRAIHIYVPEEIEYLKSIAYGRYTYEITERFNEHFDLSLNQKQIFAALKNRHICNGMNGQFRKGHKPANLGLKGIHVSPNTEFKKGQAPTKHRAIGSERTDTDGYVWIKTAEPNIWRNKHIVIWEEKNGPVPKDHVLIFEDGNKLNVNIDNLILITRRQHVTLNHMHLIQRNKETIETALLMANIRIKIADRQIKKTK